MQRAAETPGDLGRPRLLGQSDEVSARIAARVAELVAKAPPLSDAQIFKLRALVATR